MTTGWEYRIIERNTANLSALWADLDALGVEGWELVSIAGTDKTIGLNAVVGVLKRPMAVLDPPDGDREPAWLADPSGRFQHRYWDGSWWTVHVSLDGHATTDPPRVVRATEPPPTAAAH